MEIGGITKDQLILQTTDFLNIDWYGDWGQVIAKMHMLIQTGAKVVNKGHSADMQRGCVNLSRTWATCLGNPPDKPKSREVEFSEKEVLHEEIQIQ